MALNPQIEFARAGRVVPLLGGVTVERGVSSVNGGINMRDGGEIGGDVSSINGQIRLNDVTLNGEISTYNGAVELAGDTEVFGGITVNKSRNKNGYFNREKVTVISIGPNVVVHGDLVFEKIVELHIDSSAKIGNIQGKEFIQSGYYE